MIQSGMFHGTNTDQVFAEFQRRFGNIFQFWLGPSRLIIISNIDDAKHIFTHRHIYDQGDMFVEKFSIFFPHGLISIKGAKFKRHAALTLPLFRRSKIISNQDLIIDCTDKLLNRWRASPAEKVHLDIVQQSQNLLLAIFGYIAFDHDLGTLDGDGTTINNDLTQALRDVLQIFHTTIHFPVFVSIIYLKMSSRYRRTRATIEQYCNRIIEQELAENPETITQRKRTSLIASLVSSLEQDEKAEVNKNEEEKKGLSRSELLNEILVFLIAGFETTSTALSWFIHHISKYPRVQQKIKAELADDNNDKRPLSLERLDSLVYLDAVINEVLRFTLLVDGTYRTLTVDDRLPESNVQLYKGDQVCISFQNMARDPRYWSINPELFYPERFLGEDKNYHPYAFLPFGSGHRQCIGQDLARFELKVIVARLMQHVTFGDGGPQLNAGGKMCALTLMPKHVGVTIMFS